MELIVIYLLFMGISINGLIFMGMLHRQAILERRLAESIRQFNVIALSRGNK